MNRQTPIILFFLIGIFYSNAFGQIKNNWDKIEVLHGENDQFKSEQINQFQFMTELVGYAIGQDGKTLKTIDGGKTWTDQNSPSSEHLKNLFFLNENLGWIIGENRTILNTQNGGNIWQKISQIPIASILDLYFIDEKMGWFTSNDGIFQTLDGGKKWASLPGFSEVGYSKIQFTDAKNGFILHYNGLVMTNDGGRTWKLNHIKTPNSSGFNSFSFSDNNNGIIVGNYPEILLKTADGGKTWIPENGLGKIIGNDNEYEEMEFQINHISKTKIAALSNEGELFIIHTNTNEVNKIDNKFYNINISNFQFVNEQIGFIYSFPYREFLTTNDGGLSWTSLFNERYRNLNDIFFINDRIGYCVGDKGLILQTTNGGKDWNIQPSNIHNNLVRVFFSNPNQGIILSSNGDILITKNAGKNWIRQVIPVKVIFDENLVVDFTEKDITQQEKVSHLFFDIQIIDDNFGWLIGQVRTPNTPNEITLFKTENGGDSWNQVLMNQSSQFIDIEFIDKKIGYAITKHSVFRTLDGGVTWGRNPTTNFCNSGSYRSLHKISDTIMAIISDRSIIKISLTSSNDIAVVLPRTTGFMLRRMPPKNQVHFIASIPNPRQPNRLITWQESFVIRGKEIYRSNGICYGPIANLYTKDLEYPLSSLFYLNSNSLFVTGRNGYIGKIIRNN
jgi:photosystem II stability/assembly factor-like uncharacterized protein